jgi:hypothetical protein
MSKAPIRTKLVSFRVSEREYASVQRTCDRVNAESLSEFARKAIFHYADELAPAAPAPTDLHVQLDLVTIQLQSLSSALGQLKECLVGAILRDKTLEVHANGADLLARPRPALAEEVEHDS